MNKSHRQMFVSSVGLLVLIVIAAGYGCSREPHTTDTVRTPKEDLRTKYLKDFDTDSLIEVKDVRALPPGVTRPLAPGQPIIVGGLSKTSALVAYQVGDYVPTYEADAYVFRENQWIQVNTWNVVILGDSTLPQLLHGIKDAENPTMALGLEGTLSQLNLLNPIADLNRNLAQDKTYII